MKQLSLLSNRITGLLDSINDRVTSYRLVLYYLLALAGWAIVGSLFHEVRFSWDTVFISAAWLMLICWGANKLVSRFLDVPANKESDLITALILLLILTPASSGKDFAVLAGAGLAAIISKYVITYSRSHIFNPAAAGAFISGELFHQFPSWWVGTKFMTPVVLLGGLLVLRKMGRFTMVLLFLAVYILYLVYGTNSGTGLHTLWLELVSTQVLFFAIVMLTEPQTSPAVASRYLPYAALVGILYSVTRLKLSPEQALLLGNAFAFFVARNRRYRLQFVQAVKEAEGIISYIFTQPKDMKFRPGQYMEWTIAHNKTDSRGNRRYLTISSSPTEGRLMFTLKRPPEKPSAFKAQLDQLKPGDSLLASRLAGDFLLPNDPTKKIALLAGGVGITPFRSMVKYLVDKGEKRDVALLYSANSEAELAFKTLFQQAAAIGFKAYYITKGYVDGERVQKILPDYAERRFYISGPYAYVNAVESALLKLDVRPGDIVTDYFPGYGS